MRLAALACVIAGACAATDVEVQNPTAAAPPAPAAAPRDAAPRDPAPIDAPAIAAIQPPPDVIGAPLAWLKGSTHVHAKPSGDATLPIPDVIAWYERHGYDFIALTDHNRVSEVAKDRDTHGQVAVDNPAHGLIVLAGVELTHNPTRCRPETDPKHRCRIHVNVLGPTARPAGKIEWAERKHHERTAMYAAALATAKSLGGLAQINHPSWLWGMNAQLLTELAQRGFTLFEIANSQFMTWANGDAKHPSLESMWDAALTAGATLYGTGGDDAHDYGKHGKWLAGGAWVMVHARRDPQAILDALAAGRFYASTGVVLAHAEVDPATGELVVEVDAADPGAHTIDFIENGTRVAHLTARRARRAIPATGYLRAVVERTADHKQAWVEPVRRAQP